MTYPQEHRSLISSDQHSRVNQIKCFCENYKIQCQYFDSIQCLVIGIITVKMPDAKKYSWQSQEEMEVTDLKTWVEMLPVRGIGREKGKIFILLPTDN